MTVPDVVVEIADLHRDFTLLPDSPAILLEWERLVSTHAVVGRSAHDARFVSAMHVHGVTHLLTFNHADFTRFTSITVLTPAGVVALPPCCAAPFN